MSEPLVSQEPPLSYEIELLPDEQAVRGILRLPPGEHRVSCAGWVPGAYAFLRYGRDLVQLRAEAAGRALRAERDGYLGYRIERAEQPIELHFLVYCCDPAWAELAGYITSQHAVLLPTRWPALHAHSGAVEVSWKLPPNWPLHHPGGAEPLGDGRYRYANFAALLDTPVLCGQFALHKRTLHNATFYHAFLDRAFGMETELESLIDEVQDLAKLTAEALGPFPFDEYSFIWGLDPRAHWGLEHKFSTMIGVGPLALIDPQQRFDAQRVAVHELVHAWNVCRMKPRGLVQADPEHGGHCDELWMAEGVTRYYEFLLCTRAGLCSAERFFSNLVRYEQALSERPASQHTSLQDSSRATFLNHCRYPNAVNSTIDYYDAGMIAAFDLDAALRLSAQPSSLDAEMREFYKQFGDDPRGYDNEQLIALLAARQPEAAAQLRVEIEQPARFSLHQKLEALGFALTFADAPQLGVVLKQDEIEHVLAGSAAAAAGLHPGDRLLACDDAGCSAPLAWHPGALAWLVQHRSEVQLHVLRGAVRLTRTARVGARRALRELRFVGDEAQLARLVEWLGEGARALADGKPISLQHYDNFHGTSPVI